MHFLFRCSPNPVCAVFADDPNVSTADRPSFGEVEQVKLVKVLFESTQKAVISLNDGTHLLKRWLELHRVSPRKAFHDARRCPTGM